SAYEPRCLRSLLFCPTANLKHCNRSTPTRDAGSIPDIYVFNAASLAKPHAIEQLTADLTGYKIDAALICETHFKSKHIIGAFSIAGYNSFRRDRIKRRGGGVTVYTREDLGAAEWVFSGNNIAYELLWIKLAPAGQTVSFLGVIYHPPRPLYSAPDLVSYIV